MKSIVVFTVFLLASGCAHVRHSARDVSYQKPQTIKVALISNSSGTSYPMATVFLKAGWKVVDRDDLFSILKEHRLSLSGAVENEAIALGKLTGSNLVASSRYDIYGVADIRIIDVETAQIVATSSCEGSSKSVTCAAKEIVRLINQKR